MKMKQNALKKLKLKQLKQKNQIKYLKEKENQKRTPKLEQPPKIRKQPTRKPKIGKDLKQHSKLAETVETEEEIRCQLHWQ